MISYQPDMQLHTKPTVAHNHNDAASLKQLMTRLRNFFDHADLPFDSHIMARKINAAATQAMKRNALNLKLDSDCEGEDGDGKSERPRPTPTETTDFLYGDGTGKDLDSETEQ